MVWRMVKRFFLILLIASMLTVGCGDQPPKVEKPPLVRTLLVAETGTNADDIYSGTVRGRYETNMSFQVGGRIINRAVDVGSRVSIGDTLMSLDAADLNQQVNQAEAQIASAEAQLNLAHRNFDRYRQLYSENAIPAATLDRYRAEYDAAEAALDNAQAAARQSYNALSYTRLIAEADGVISAINAEEGQVVAAGQSVLTLVQTGELEVEINVPENKLPILGESAVITFWASSIEIRAEVREIAPMADAASRTYRVRLSLDEPPSTIQLGMTASARFKSNAVDGISIPLTAIDQSEELPRVWIVDENQTVRTRNVDVRQFDGNQALVNGIKRGELIVTAGVNKLREGQQVRVNPTSET